MNLEQRARKLAVNTAGYYRDPGVDSFLVDAIEKALLRFASEVKKECADLVEPQVREIKRYVREETIRECADLTREPCPYYPRPCGDCRHCFLTKAAARLLSLLNKSENK